MSLDVTPRAVEVLRRALDAARLDPARTGVRVAEARGMRGSEIRTGFADEPEPGDETIDAGGIRIYVPAALARRDATIDVSDEHERIVLR
jgi:Fe-S cluster assembly iron-binding protein IscA